MKKLRLNFPQWQGAGADVVAHLVPELPSPASRQGYVTGSQLLGFLSKPHDGITHDVPVAMDFDTPAENGIAAYQAVKNQLNAAMTIIEQEAPSHITTLGGDCAVSIAPFAYLADKYADDVAIVWIDAHPDLGLPYDEYDGFHAMALAQILGFGDKTITDLLPKNKVKTQNALIVGLRYFGEPAEQRRKDWGIETVSCETANQGSEEVLAWLAKQGKSKVLIHLDLDVLDPLELKIAVGTDPDGMSLQAVSRLINDIGKQAEIVGFTVAEPMPREVIKLQNLLHSLPL